VSGVRGPHDPIVAVTGWKLERTGLALDLRTASGRAARLVARAVSPEAWKLTLVPEGSEPPRPTPMVVAANVHPLRLTVKAKENGRILITGAELRLEIRLDPFGVRFLDRSEQSVLTDNPGDIDGLGRPAVPCLGFALSPGGAPAGITAAFHLRPGERLYGLGEKFTRLDKGGQRIVSWTVDALGSTSERSHKNVPFLWSTRGAGVFLDTGARVAWDLGTMSLQSWTFEADTPALEMYVFHGPRPDRILAAYTAITGRPPAVPDWSFGLWLSSGGTYRDQAAIETLLDGIERHRVPAAVVHIDPWWMRWRKYCDFAWDREAFPDPEGLIRRVHDLGLKLCLWEHPYISVESELYAFGRDKGYFALRPDGEVAVIDYGLSLAPRPDGVIRVAGRAETWNAPVAIVDLTDPAARAWFKDLHRPLLRMGVDVFKTDFGEDIPEDARFRDGRTGHDLHNLYPLLYNAAVFEVTAEEKGYGLVWSRSGTAGSQRYPVCWSGDPASDWDSLAATIRGGLSAGMSGLALWSHDIGGYRGTPDPELYVRWAQFGLLSSHSRMHGDSPREPWLFGGKALAIVRKYAALREKLRPYLVKTAREASRTGMPVLRALPLAFPDDPNAAAWEHEYMFGPSILAAPVIRPLAELHRRGGRPVMPVYLPGGKWIDHWTGRTYQGPAVIERAVPLSVMPLFTRKGAHIWPRDPGAGGKRRRLERG
jgi:alpha-D-xyloside xylohydrolase